MDHMDDNVGRLSERVSSQFDELSPQLRKAARYMLDHPDDVALRSMRQLATDAGLPAATFIRLARALGYSEYNELRMLFEKRMRRRLVTGADYLSKARDLQLRGQVDGTHDLIRDLFEADIRNVEGAFQNNGADAFVRATKLIEQAKRVFIVGQRSCYSIAFFFNYVYRLARGNSILLESYGGVLGDELRDIGKGDALISISLAPYTKSVVEVTTFAQERGAKILAITDDKLSALGRLANEVLVASTKTPSFFHSLISLVSITQTLLALLVARGGKETTASIKQSEKQIERFNPYWVDVPKKRSES